MVAITYMQTVFKTSYLHANIVTIVFNMNLLALNISYININKTKTKEDKKFSLNLKGG